MYLFTTVPHPHGHWQLQELLGNNTNIPSAGVQAAEYRDNFGTNLLPVVSGHSELRAWTPRWVDSVPLSNKCCYELAAKSGYEFTTCG